MIRSVKEMLHVELVDSERKYYGKSIGLMGAYGTGALLGRNGTLIEDHDDFGQEWQGTNNLKNAIGFLFNY